MSLPEALLSPISETNRAGDYLRYDPVYDQIREARREDLDIPQGGWQQALKRADWPLVIKLTTEVLSKRSKDLQVAAWLTEAMLRRNGYAGLRDGLALMAGLLEEFWDELYPEIEDGDLEMRAVPIEWIAGSLDLALRAVPINAAGHSVFDYAVSSLVPTEAEADSDDDRASARAKAIADGKITPEEFEEGFATTPKAWYRSFVGELEGVLEQIDALDRIGDERFGSDAPGLYKLRNAVQEIRQTAGQLLARKLKDDPDPIQVDAVFSDATLIDADTAGGGAATAEGMGDGWARSAASGNVPGLDEPSARIAAAARMLRGAAPADPAPYLLLRGYRWGELRRDPAAIDPKLLEAPPTELRSRLKTLLLDEQWPALLAAGEDVMAAPYGRGWLDLQRYAVTACDALGPDYEAVGQALRGALAALLKELPQLPELTLLDDSPTANTETRGWLQAEGLRAAPDRGNAAAAAPEPRDVLARARALAGNGSPQRAIELLVQEASRERSERGRFVRRTQAASLMVDAGLEQVALPILNELVEQIEAHRLEQWEDAETVALPLGLLYTAIARQDPSDSSLGDLYLRICRLDPLRAIEIYQTAAGDGNG